MKTTKLSDVRSTLWDTSCLIYVKHAYNKYKSTLTEINHIIIVFDIMFIVLRINLIRNSML